MTTALKLRELLRNGIHRIGELELLSDVYGFPYAICHMADAELATEPAFGGLEVHKGQMMPATYQPTALMAHTASPKDR